MQKISGGEIAQKIINELKSKPVPKKILAAVLVGENPTSISFLKQKEKIAKELGVDFRVYKFSDGLKNDDLRKEIGKIAKLSRVGGVIVQLPLPEHINRRYVLNAIPPEKDVDVLSEKAKELVKKGENKILPPAVGVVDEIIHASGFTLHDSRVAIVGVGFLVGQPIFEWLKDKTRELKTFDLGDNLDELKKFDLIISGVGKAGLIKPEMLKDDSVIIDFGYDMKEIRNEKGEIRKQIFGDFDVSLIYNLSSLLYTPTPGGTGPILVAELFENFYKLNQ